MKNQKHRAILEKLNATIAEAHLEIAKVERNIKTLNDELENLRADLEGGPHGVESSGQ